MSSPVKKMFVSAFVAAGLLTQAGVAHADELNQSGSTEKVAEATAPLPGGVENSDDVPAVKPRSAEGVTWAPGGFGAANTLYVDGKGTYVNYIRMAYNLGASPGNACVDGFEIAYRENGRRVVRNSGPNCALYRTTHTFQVDRNLDSDSQVCGRAHVRSAGAGNWACITIKP